MATGDKLVNLDELKLVYDKLHVPSVQVQIPTGQWSGSSTRTYTVNATGVTADTIIDWAMDSSINYLTSELTVTPGSGTITFSTPTLPSGTINVTLFFPGVNGEVVIQTLADVYSKSQVDQLISQSTANRTLLFIGTTTPDNSTVYALSDAYTKYNWIMIRWVTNDDTGFQILNVADIEQNISKGPMFVALAANAVGQVSSFPYMASCRIHFTDSTHFKVLGFWTNSNYVAKVTNVWGINPK